VTVSVVGFIVALFVEYPVDNVQRVLVRYCSCRCFCRPPRMRMR